MTPTAAPHPLLTTPKTPPKPSTFSCKVTLALTGSLLAVFVFVHMVGNLKAYFGAASYNAYSLWLRQAFSPVLPHEGLLWIMRAVLGPALVLHVGAAALVWWRGRRARGRFWARGADWSARSMPWTGLLLLAFVVFHLLDLTLGLAGPASYRAATASESFAYQNTVASLGRPLAGAAYLVTMVALGVHLAHGLWTTATDLGVTGRRLRAVWRPLAWAVGLLVTLGNASLPIAIWLGALS